MKRFVKVGVLALFTIMCLITISATVTNSWPILLGPNTRPLTSRTFEPTPSRLERGKYLSENVLGCFDCHSQRNWDLPGAPPIAEMKGAGFVIEEEGFGKAALPNITPDVETGAGSWTDDMLARAIREGIGHDGRALFPFMPYQDYSALSDEDLASVIVYLRSIPAVRNELPKSEIPFPINFLIRNAPRPITSPVAEPDLSDSVKRGAYLVQIAACTKCHTPSEKGTPVAGMEFAGGHPFEGPFGKVASANLTPDASGIPYYDEALFLKAIRTGHVGARKLSSVMPWVFYRNMTDQDLKSIFAYLQTLKPVSHRVDNSEPPKLCKKCGAIHGGGEGN
jgi:mono/diheme cytochrome c family protein